MKYRVLATTIFGLEAVCAEELRELGFSNVEVHDGRVIFGADESGIALANMCLRTAERIYILLGEFEAKDFDALFDGVRRMPFEMFLKKDSSFPVFSNSVRSKLTSVPAIQRTAKKAVVEKMRHLYRTEVLPETGAEYPIFVNLLKDKASVLLDTSGSGLHRRGYREYGNLAPLKETLAAALVRLSKWRPDSKLVDPFCGSGTILVEAVHMALNIPANAGRHFPFEKWERFLPKMVKEVRHSLIDKKKFDTELLVEGYDIDPMSIKQARINAEKAGIAEHIHFQVRDIQNFSSHLKKGTIISNLPYGERMEDAQRASQIYKVLGKVMEQYPGWYKFFLTSHENFENDFGTKADKNRKLYNAKLKAYLYQYRGKK